VFGELLFCGSFHIERWKGVCMHEVPCLPRGRQAGHGCVAVWGEAKGRLSKHVLVPKALKESVHTQQQAGPN
jgi:hypothetical protein